MKTGAIPLDDLPRPGVAIPLARWLELLAAEAENVRLRSLLEDVLNGSSDQKLTANEGPSLEPSLRADIRAALANPETKQRAG